MSKNVTHLPQRGLTLITSFFQVTKVRGTISIGAQQPVAASPIGSSSSATAARQEEYLSCLRYNVMSPAIDRILLLVEGPGAFQLLRERVLEPAARSPWSPAAARLARKKIVPLLVGGQPLYSDFFHIANKLGCSDAAGRKKLCMVCNADIHLPTLCSQHFDVHFVDELFCLASQRQKRIALALTRYEREADNSDDIRSVAPLIDDYRGSHDAFLFESPLPSTFVESVAHPQNCYKAENIVLHELLHSGGMDAVLNPCKTLRIIHQHATDIRQWFPPVDEERYGRAYPSTLDEAKHTILTLP